MLKADMDYLFQKIRLCKPPTAQSVRLHSKSGWALSSARQHAFSEIQAAGLPSAKMRSVTENEDARLHLARLRAFTEIQAARLRDWAGPGTKPHKDIKYLEK